MPLGTKKVASDVAPWLAARNRRYPRTTRKSLYLPMRDGTRIAVDVHLPKVHRGALPTMIRQTRYYRGFRLRGPFAHMPIEWLIDHTALTRDYFLDHGYAWVDVCVRGSGASHGRRPLPWAPNEITDGSDIVDWIVAQPWSNGRVGSTGVSYDGTCAEFLLANNHPAVRAIAPRFCLFDVYSDVAFPGGIHLAWFTESWNTFNVALDAGGLDVAFALKIRNQIRALRQQRRRQWLERLLELADRDEFHAFARPLMQVVSSGVRPVDGDDGRELAAAFAGHGDNFNVHRAALEMRYRDDVGMSADFPGATINTFSPHTKVSEIRSSGAAIYNYSGWCDASYQHSAVKRFLTIDNTANRLILGPWEHGGMQNTSPYSAHDRTAFPHDEELLHFFDAHLRPGHGGVDTPRVRYFTVGQERWKSAASWPPPEAQYASFHFDDDRALSARKPTRAAVDEYRVDLTVGSGARSRWNTLLGLLLPVRHTMPERAAERVLFYRSAPLASATEVTGHPLVTLSVGSDQAEAHVFVYLFDEYPDGRSVCVTEGQLDLHHRTLADTRPYASPVPYRSYERHHGAPMPPGQVQRVVLDLFPVSWQFQAGHRYVVAIAGADCDHFDTLAVAPTLAIYRGGDHESRIDLPVVPNN